MVGGRGRGVMATDFPTSTWIWLWRYFLLVHADTLRLLVLSVHSQGEDYER